jgi:hypothetical protein
MIGGQLWQDNEGGAGVYNDRHGFTAVQWPPGYTVDYGDFLVFNNFTLYDAQGRKVGEGGDTVSVFGDWARSVELFVACAVGRVIAAEPDDPPFRGVLPIEACVVWQGIRREHRGIANQLLVPDADVCGTLRTL